MSEEKKASDWFNKLTDDEVKQLIINAYRAHLVKIEERKELGFKYAVD